MKYWVWVGKKTLLTQYLWTYLFVRVLWGSHSLPHPPVSLVGLIISFWPCALLLTCCIDRSRVACGRGPDLAVSIRLARTCWVSLVSSALCPVNCAPSSCDKWKCWQPRRFASPPTLASESWLRSPSVWGSVLFFLVVIGHIWEVTCLSVLYTQEQQRAKCHLLLCDLVQVSLCLPWFFICK